MYRAEMLYIGILAIIMVLYLFTFNYKKGEPGVCRKGKYKYWFLCGMSMFIVDKIRKNKRHSGKRKISEKLQRLHIKDMVAEEEYIYTVDKVSLIIMFFSIIIFLGLAFNVGNSGRQKRIMQLDRPDYGQVPEEYLLEAQNGTEKETIHIVVKQKEYKEEEIEKIMEDSYKDIVKTMLGKNKSLSEIYSNLVFDSDYGKEGISLSWGTDNPDVIGYAGEVYRQKCDIDLKVYLTMSFAGITRTYDIDVTVKAAQQTDSMAGKVQEAVDSYDNYADRITLPKELNGNNIYYFQALEQTNIPFVVVAIIVSAVIYFVKDKDVDKELEIRKKQMENDYSEIVSKLMLFNSAGMSIRTAWQRILEDYDKYGKKRGKRYAYEEMRLAENKMKSGVSEGEAYHDFGRRCNIHNYIKLASILEQNLVKGTKGMRQLLEYEVHEAFEERKRTAKKHGDEAGTKMLLPMAIMLVISILIVILPSFLSMGMI